MAISIYIDVPHTVYLEEKVQRILLGLKLK